MKNLLYLILLVLLTYLSCKSGENRGNNESPILSQDSSIHTHSKFQHFLRVYSYISETISYTPNPNNTIAPCVLGGTLFACINCYCNSPTRTLQILKVGKTDRKAWKNYENKHIYLFTKESPVNDLIAVENDTSHSMFYIKGMTYGVYGCNPLICCNVAGDVDTFHYNNKIIMNMPMALHENINPRTQSIDTLINIEFKISQFDYDRLNSALKTYKSLQCGVDSSDYSYINIAKSGDTTLLFKIYQDF